MRMIIALVLAAGLVTACSWPDEEAVYPLPSAAVSWPLPSHEQLGQAICPTIDLAPVKVDWDATHRSLSMGGQKVFWPKGFSARELPSGRLEILAPDTTVVARDGDTVSLGGSDYMHVCRVQSVAY
jgi:hypothetical protein